jgi:hypothetical protein
MHKKKGIACSKRSLMGRRRGSSKRNYEYRTEKRSAKRLEKATVDTIHNQGNLKQSK